MVKHAMKSILASNPVVCICTLLLRVHFLPPVKLPTPNNVKSSSFSFVDNPHSFAQVRLQVMARFLSLQEAEKVFHCFLKERKTDHGTERFRVNPMARLQVCMEAYGPWSYKPLV
jgi:hypothetical protein